MLHRVAPASLVAFVDFDNELLSARMRAAEQAFVLLGRAARLVGGMTGDHTRRIVVQTRLPADPVLGAARSGDPGGFFDVELSPAAATSGSSPYSGACARIG